MSGGDGRRQPRVLVADDYAPVRLGIREDLERDAITVCAEAATGAEALEGALREQPDLCLLDVHMEEGNGLTATAAIHDELPQAKLLLITALPDEEGVLAAARAGADGLLDKAIDFRRLPTVVRAVISGETAFPRRLLGRLLEEVRRA